MRIGITGSAGLIGWHMRCHLKQFAEHEVVIADRATFADAGRLEDFAGACDAIAHFAGVNRASDEEIAATNPRLARDLVDACDRAGVTPHIAFSSSTQIERDNVYSRAKRATSDVFAAWAARTGAAFTNVVLPHVFGECGKPFYNSVVSTFAYQLANGETPQIHADGDLELLHAQAVAALFLEALTAGQTGELRPAGVAMKVSELLERLRSVDASYRAHVVPDLRERIQHDLFNVYRTYLFPAHYPCSVPLHADARGHLFESIKNLNGGQTFISTTKPGITRGNHFHFHKVERFFVLQGEATIRLRRLFDDHVHEFTVSGSEPQYIDMPPLHTHNITNTGDSELLTLFWAHEIFDPQRPDTLAEPV
jgi:UDP-2-acetamido-2,6-beta-L-arabino-hexul-4-ose reductase